MIETGILSCVLAENCLGDVIELLRPCDFIGYETKKIYEKMLDNFHKSLPVTRDCILIDGLDFDQEKLIGTSKKDPVMVLREDLKQYCNMLKAQRKKRKLKEIIFNAHTLDQNKSADEVIEYLNVELENLDSSVIDETFEKVGEIAKRNVERMLAGKQLGLRIGDFWFDKMTLGFFPNEVIMLSGRPGTGKTAYSIHLAIKTAQKGIKVAYFSFEMTSQALTERMICSMANVQSKKSKLGTMSDGEKQAYINSAKELEKLPIEINDSNKHTVDDIRAIVKKLVFEKNVKVVFIDYIGLITKNRGKEERLALAEIADKIKDITKDYEISIVLLAQLNRDCTNRSNKRPQLSDFEGSGRIEQSCDKSLMLYREWIDNPEANPRDMEVIISKSREGETGVYHVEYNLETQKITDQRNLNHRLP